MCGFVVLLFYMVALGLIFSDLWAEIRQAAGNERAAILADGGSHLKQKLLNTLMPLGHSALSPAPALGAGISQSLLFAGILIVPDVTAVVGMSVKA